MSEQNKEIKGSVAVSGRASIGGGAVVRGSVKVGRGLKVGGWLDAPNVKGPCKGLYASGERLKEAYPQPRPGEWALVGDGLPADIWRARAKEEGGCEWAWTGEQGGEPSVYVDYLDTAVEELESAVNELQSTKEEIEYRVREVESESGRATTALSHGCIDPTTLAMAETQGGLALEYDILTLTGEGGRGQLVLPVVTNTDMTATINAAVGMAMAQMAGMGSELGALKGRVATLEADMATVKADIAQMKSQLSQASTQIGSIAASMVLTTERLTDVQAATREQSTTITDLRLETIADLQRLTTRVTGVETAAAGLDTRVTANAASVSGLATRMTANESSVSGLVTRVTANESSMSGLATRVTANESRIQSIAEAQTNPQQAPV